jgi:hypothetical protein
METMGNVEAIGYESLLFSEAKISKIFDINLISQNVQNI